MCESNSRRSGFLVTVACASSRRLDAGVEASGPHDFAVRESTVRQRQPSASTASRTYVRDDRETPLCVRRDGNGDAVAVLVGIEGGVVSGVINLESSGVEASDWRPRHDEQYNEA